jgi:hypothetical protein
MRAAVTLGWVLDALSPQRRRLVVVGLAHQTRSRLSSPSNGATPAKDSLSGTLNDPEVSTRPDQAGVPEAEIRAAIST